MWVIIIDINIIDINIFYSISDRDYYHPLAVSNGHSVQDCEAGTVTYHCDTFGDVFSNTWDPNPWTFNCNNDCDFAVLSGIACVPSKTILS